jgi:SPOR domain
MATPINAPMAGEIWHLSIEDLFQPVQEAPRLGGDGPFVINLSVSTAPIGVPAKSFAGCRDAHIYQIQVTEDGRTRFRLRIGPFMTEDEADAILAEVRDTYPGALTATAGDSDLRVIGTMQAKVEARQSSAQKPTGKTAPKLAAPAAVASEKPAPVATVPQKDAEVIVAPKASVAKPTVEVDEEISIDIAWPTPELAIPRAPPPRALPEILAASPQAKSAPAAQAPRDLALQWSLPELDIPLPNKVSAAAKVTPTLTEVVTAAVKPAAPKIIAQAPLAMMAPVLTEAVVPIPRAAATKPAAPKAAAPKAAAPIAAPVVAPPLTLAPPFTVAPTPAVTPTLAITPPLSVTPPLTLAPPFTAAALTPAVAPTLEVAPSSAVAPPLTLAPPFTVAPTPAVAPTLAVAPSPAVAPSLTLAQPFAVPTPAVTAAPASKPPAMMATAPIKPPLATKPSAAASPAKPAATPAPPTPKRAAPVANKGSPVLTQSVASHAKSFASKLRASAFNTSASKLTSLQHVVVATAPAPAAREVKKLDKPLDSLESTQTMRALTPVELEDIEASRWFVIELAVADQAFDPDAVPNLDLFDEYRLYSVAGVDQGRAVHALRLGFFREEIGAVAVASYLAAYWDKPAIKRVSLAERERFAVQRVEARKDVGATGRHAVIEITDELVARRRRTPKSSVSTESSNHPSGH